MLAGERRGAGHQLSGRALENDPAAVVPCSRAEVDDPVRVRHHGLVVLDHDDRLARVHQAVEEAEQLLDVGLGYLTLGQALNTLSGGERQRLKLAISMAKKGAIYVLDEPTTGLHLADVDNMLGMLDRLVDAGNSGIVIEHHQAVMAHADWIIDLGPGAGHDGGRVVFEGTPADLVTARSTLTAEHLAAYVGA